MIKNTHVLVTSILAFCGAACSDAADEVERTYDCAQICEKYADCYDEDLNQTECVDSCEDNGDVDDDFEEQANDCEDCIDDSSCAAATLECTDECAGVVVGSTE